MSALADAERSKRQLWAAPSGSHDRLVRALQVILPSLVGALAAVLVTVWFTFLPSFGFILAGAPLVEASRNDLRLGAPLSAITAVVVGVIASLALFFAGPVLWPAGGMWARQSDAASALPTMNNTSRSTKTACIWKRANQI
mgnify:CR=1 FL=1